MKNISKTTVSCEDCQLAIIAGNTEDAAIAEHLLNCPECRDFARFQSDILQVEASCGKSSPELEQIKSAMRRQERVRYNCLRFIVLPTAVAAAAMVAVCGIFFHMGPAEAAPEYMPEYTIAADHVSFVAAMEEADLALAWDQLDNGGKGFMDSISAVRNSADWSIELFNPYSEELL